MITVYTQFEQGTDLWFLARLGLPTASRFKTVMSKGTKDPSSVMRADYIDELTAELHNGIPTVGYSNLHMERGKLQEADALAAYEISQQCKVDRVGFVRNDEPMPIGCAPDGLVGNDGGVEVKTLLPKLMVRMRCAPGVPQQHMPQIQGNMLVTGRQWWDVVFYTPGFDLIVERVGREETYINEIKRFLIPFQEELEARVFKNENEEWTFKARRKQRDKQFLERIDEEVEQEELPMPWPRPDPLPPSITEKLRASLALEDE